MCTFAPIFATRCVRLSVRTDVGAPEPPREAADTEAGPVAHALFAAPAKIYRSTTNYHSSITNI